MKLINKIEIKYFRSIHNAKVTKCNDLNVLSGRNDVGKSNFIKALNLFFNGRTDWSESFEFYDNFSKKRLETVRSNSVKGKQFISIKIEFLRPDGYKRSLPERFEVERKWYRDGEYYEQKDFFTTQRNKGTLPGTLSAAQTSLTKFLNKIHFEYVPAIKDRNYFQSLLIRMQDELLSNSIPDGSGLSQTASDLAENISDQITALKVDFESATAVETAIRPPETISALFQSFMVSTSTKYGDIPLKYRGDGLQARYIASALNFFSNSQSKNFIWGFEEPEIALELSHALSLANDFEGTYCKNAQIFLTSHSLAFIALNSEHVSCYRVFKEEDSEDSLITLLDGRSSRDYKALKEDMGIFELQKEMHEEYVSKVSELENIIKKVDKLEVEIASSNLPLVLTEGVTDVPIISLAKDKLGIIADFIIRSCDNSQGSDTSNGGADQLKKAIETIHPDDDRKVIAVFDNDIKGQTEFKKLSKNFSMFNNNKLIKKHRNGYAFAMLLPVPSFRDASHNNLCIELLFKDVYLARKNGEGKGLTVTKEVLVIRTHSGIPITLPDATREEIEDSLPLKIEGGKRVFSGELVPDFDPESFEGFVEFFEMISSILE